MFEKGIGRSGPLLVSLFIIWRPEKLLAFISKALSPYARNASVVWLRIFHTRVLRDLSPLPSPSRLDP